MMSVQQEIAFAWNDAQIGKQIDILIDAPVPGEETAWIGRSYAEAPDVDGVIYVTETDVTETDVTETDVTETDVTKRGTADERLSVGALVKCEIVARRDYDLIAVAIGKPR